MNKAEEIRFVILRSLGNFLVLIALYGVLLTFAPIVKYQLQFQIIQLRHIHFTIESASNKSNVSVNSTSKKINKNIISYNTSAVPNPTFKPPSFAQILEGSQQQILIPIDPMFSILIPKLGIDEQVIANVDPNDPNSYLPVLQHAVAHAKGSVFPGDQGTTYLFAHSAENWWDIEHYNAIFYTLNNLSLGDEIVIFYNNRRYDYEVTEQIISDPNDTTLLTGEHSGPPRLVLQTCWPPGTSLKRLYVIAVPKKI